MAKGYLYDNGYEIISREDALPDASEASQGDVLSLDEDKKPVWSAPSGGGGESPIVKAFLNGQYGASPTVSFTKPNSQVPLTFAELVEMGGFVAVGRFSACFCNAYSDEEGGQTYKGINMALTEYLQNAGHYSRANVYHVSVNDNEITDDMTVFPIEAGSHYIEFTTIQ